MMLLIYFVVFDYFRVLDFEILETFLVSFVRRNIRSSLSVSKRLPKSLNFSDTCFSNLPVRRLTTLIIFCDFVVDCSDASLCCFASI